MHEGRPIAMFHFEELGEASGRFFLFLVIHGYNAIVAEAGERSLVATRSFRLPQFVPHHKAAAHG